MREYSELSSRASLMRMYSPDSLLGFLSRFHPYDALYILNPQGIQNRLWGQLERRFAA